jgi:flagellar hook assembly protein FlgD
MKANFDSLLHLENGGTRVDAAGPLDWEGASGQCDIAVTITQSVNGGTVVARGDTGSYNQGDSRWDTNADVQNGQRLQPGSAQAQGVINLRGSQPIPWGPQNVTLQ